MKKPFYQDVLQLNSHVDNGGDRSEQGSQLSEPVGAIGTRGTQNWGRISRGNQSKTLSTPVKVLMPFWRIGLLTTQLLIAELRDIRRFANPHQLIGNLGLVPGEHSSGNRTKRSGITRTGSVRGQKALVSTAWKYIHYCLPTSVSLRE